MKECEDKTRTIVFNPMFQIFLDNMRKRIENEILETLGLKTDKHSQTKGE